MRRRRPLFATCLAALIVLQSKADNEELPEFEVSISGPGAVLLGGPANFTATVTPGDGSYSYQWKVDDVEQVETGSTLTFPRPGSTAAKEVTVRCTATDTSDPEIKKYKDVTFWHVQVEPLVEGADEIWKGTYVTWYATARNQMHGTISLVVPRDAILPDDFITWTGGTEAANPRQRLFSRAALQPDGVQLTARKGTQTLFDSLMFVFQEKPEVAPATITVDSQRDLALDVGTAFGKARTPTQPDDSTYIVYYENKRFRFELDTVRFDATWNLHPTGRGRRDVPHDFAWPGFPLGFDMNLDTSDIERRYAAKADLAPNSGGVPTFARYWASHVVAQHEEFHIDDWAGNKRYTWLPDAVAQAEADIRNESAPLSKNVMCPAKALDEKKTVLDNKIKTQADEMKVRYKEEAEERAYADGHSTLQQLSNSIRIAE